MATEVTCTPLLTRIREDPRPHTSPDQRMRAKKNTLRWNCLPFHRAKNLSCEGDRTTESICVQPKTFSSTRAKLSSIFLHSDRQWARHQEVVDQEVWHLHKLQDHDIVPIKKFVRPNLLSSNKTLYRRQTVKLTGRKSLQPLPTPTIRTSSNTLLCPDHCQTSRKNFSSSAASDALLPKKSSHASRNNLSTSALDQAQLIEKDGVQHRPIHTSPLDQPTWKQLPCAIASQS